MDGDWKDLVIGFFEVELQRRGAHVKTPEIGSRGAGF
jgi:hypothetical protein